MADEFCSVCHEPLVLEIEPDSDDEYSKHRAQMESIPDDVELSCGCHYHWECFIDAYTLTECPNCSKNISSQSTEGEQQVLCIVRNEGGTQHNFDILPSATEEAYLRAYPEEREGHAFLEFCRAGDLDAIINLIRDVDEDDEGNEEDHLDVLRYQGSFEGIDGSGLHVAIRYGREEVAWLLLALASKLEWAKFTPTVFQAMQSFGLSKDDRSPGIDIRTLKDKDGRTPQRLAEQLGGVWSTWISAGRFTV